jgi:hypothetical protein
MDYNRTFTITSGLTGNIIAPFNVIEQTGGSISGKVVAGNIRFCLQMNIPTGPHTVSILTLHNAFDS